MIVAWTRPAAALASPLWTSPVEKSFFGSCEEQLACYVMQAPHCSTCTCTACTLCCAIWDVLCPWRCSALSPSMGTGMGSWWLQRAAKPFYTHDEIRHVLMHLVQVGGSKTHTGFWQLKMIEVTKDLKWNSWKQAWPTTPFHRKYVHLDFSVFIPFQETGTNFKQIVAEIQMMLLFKITNNCQISKIWQKILWKNRRWEKSCFKI